MLKKILLFAVICTLFTSLAWAGADWKKVERPAKVSLYDVMKEIQANRQSILVLKEEIRELKGRLARVEIRQPAPADKIDKLRLDALASSLSLLGGLLAAVALVVIGMVGFIVYSMRGRKT